MFLLGNVNKKVKVKIKRISYGSCETNPLECCLIDGLLDEVRLSLFF